MFVEELKVKSSAKQTVEIGETNLKLKVLRRLSQSMGVERALGYEVARHFIHSCAHAAMRVPGVPPRVTPTACAALRVSVNVQRGIAPLYSIAH